MTFLRTSGSPPMMRVFLTPPSDEHRTEPVELLQRSSMHETRARKRAFSTLSLTVLTIPPKSKLGIGHRSANRCALGDIRKIRNSAVEAMKFRPLHDRVVVRRIEENVKTAGGIIIPDTAKEKPMQAEVIAVGPGARDESGKIVPLDVKKGDRVLFGKWSGTEVKIDGEELLIMKESDILGVIEGKASVRAAA